MSIPGTLRERAVRGAPTGTGDGPAPGPTARHVTMIKTRAPSVRWARYDSRSVVDSSAQCTSSNQRMTGCTRPASSRRAAISRFRRSCEPPAVSAARRAAEESLLDGGVICAYQLGATARMSRVMLPELIVVLQAFERFEHRKIGFSACEPLRTATAADPHSLAMVVERAHERLDQRRLADAGFCRDDDEAALPRLARSNSWYRTSISSSRPTTAAKRGACAGRRRSTTTPPRPWSRARGPGAAALRWRPGAGANPSAASRSPVDRACAATPDSATRVVPASPTSARAASRAGTSR